MNAPTLQPQARGAQEAVQALERALAQSRSHWNDATRQAFDQRHAEAIVTSGRRVASEMDSLAQELAAALASMPDR